MADDALSCPECRFSTAAAGSDHLPGDICPDCHKGYLESSDAALSCPECRFVATPDSDADHLVGDICPDCHKGYLEAE